MNDKAYTVLVATYDSELYRAFEKICDGFEVSVGEMVEAFMKSVVNGDLNIRDMRGAKNETDEQRSAYDTIKQGLEDAINGEIRKENENIV